MTEDQKEARAERVAIMMICGKVSESDAHRFCDTMPHAYGIMPRNEKQIELIPEQGFKFL